MGKNLGLCVKRMTTWTINVVCTTCSLCTCEHAHVLFVICIFNSENGRMVAHTCQHTHTQKHLYMSTRCVATSLWSRRWWCSVECVGYNKANDSLCLVYIVVRVYWNQSVTMWQEGRKGESVLCWYFIFLPSLLLKQVLPLTEIHSSANKKDCWIKSSGFVMITADGVFWSSNLTSWIGPVEKDCQNKNRAYSAWI